MVYSVSAFKSKDQYKSIIDVIKTDSAVGIDAQYTHAIIIECLKDITGRLEKIEKEINHLKKP